MRTRLGVAATLAAAAVVAASSFLRAQSATTPLPLDSYVEALRRQSGIPGLSALIQRDDQVIWERGYGFQDIENSVRATPDTPYYIGDLSQTIASGLVLNCAERGLLSLDDTLDAPSSTGGGSGGSAATLRELLAHAAPAGASEPFRYDPARFAVLTGAIERCTRMVYRTALRENIFSPFAMLNSVPGLDLTDPAAPPLFSPAITARYLQVLSRLAIPYKVDGAGRATRSDLPSKSVDASTGIVTTVRDLARFDSELESGVLLQDDTRQAAWTNARSAAGVELPTGFGWFVQQYQGERLVWHYGLTPDRYSALLIKVPAKHLTVILLANSDGLAKSAQLHQGDVTKSLFARLFLTVLL